AAVVAPGVQNALTHGKGLRHWLVGLQFSIAIALSISSLVVFRQIRFLDEHPLGYNPKGLLVLEYMDWGNAGSFFQQEIKKLPGVTATAITSWRPGSSGAGSSGLWQDPKNPSIKIPIQEILSDAGFAQLIGLHLVRGRLLYDNLPGDAPNYDSLMQTNMSELDKIQSVEPCLVTQATALRLGITELGHPFPGIGTPVGIVSDFNIATLKSPMDLCVIYAKSKSVYGALLVRIAADNPQTTAGNIAGKFASLYPAQPFNGRWATDMLAAQYDNERRLLTIFGIFAGLTVFLACLGLFGLVVLMLQARLKEIGIRKVLGASTAGIARMLAWGFLRLVVIAGLFAIPAIWYCLSQWLDNYAYRIDIKMWMVTTPFILVLGAALLTIFIKTIRTSFLNPADVLREE
ncbi:MAG TPA: FtsX-like permease family protein, partial [Puia sp.]|nr:FtsX-like permease family protein [Puia sp.]